jgi:malate synthase
MSARVTVAGLQIARPLHDLVHDEILPGTGISSDTLWQGFAGILCELTPRNRALLARRDELQARIDAWHLSAQGPAARRRSLQGATWSTSATCCRRARTSPSPPKTSIPKSPASPARSWWCR